MTTPGLAGQCGSTARGEPVVDDVRSRQHEKDRRGGLHVGYGRSEPLDETLLEER
jgi:hypothetical protein